MIAEILKQVLTEDDANSVYCPIRLLATFIVLTYISLSVYGVLNSDTHHFDMQSFGIGAGAVIAAAGAAIGMKAKLGG